MKRFALDARSATDHFPGIGRYVSNLAGAMVNQLAPDESLLLLVDNTRSSRWQLPYATENVIIVETAVSPFALSQQPQIPRLLRQENIQVYHSPYYLIPYFMGIPTLVTIHDLIPQLFPHYFSFKTRLFSNFFKRLAIKRASAIIADSEATRQDILEKYSLAPAKITTVPLAADPRFQPQSKPEIQRVRRVHRLPEQYILYLGSNKPHKNLVCLVEAYAQVANLRISPPPLVITGAWDNRYQEAMQKAESLNLGQAVRFIGSIPEVDLPALYSGALIFMFPSVYEGFGLPVIEAMACGTPVACSNTSSLPEVAGDAAIYFDPTRIDDIASAILGLLDDDVLRSKLRQDGLARVRSFSWSYTAQATLELYRSLALS